jgi:hypothetical protein
MSPLEVPGFAATHVRIAANHRHLPFRLRHPGNQKPGMIKVATQTPIESEYSRVAAMKIGLVTDTNRIRNLATASVVPVLAIARETRSMILTGLDARMIC